MKRIVVTLLALVLFSPIGTSAQASLTAAPDDAIIEGVVQIKVEESVVAAIEQTTDARGMVEQKTAEGVPLTGIASLDALGEEYDAVRIERVFRPAGKHEARHRQFGLHRWYRVTFNETSLTQNTAGVREAVRAYAAASGVEIAEATYEKSFSDGYEPGMAPRRVAAADAVRVSTLPRRSLSGVEGVAGITNDPLYSDQWHYHNTGQLPVSTPDADIDLPEAHNIETGDASVVVSIHDQGIQTDHEDLAANMWVNEGEVPGNDVDDDDNGFVDDVYGYNFADDQGTINPGNHGTHVAGTVAAVNNNETGVAGVAGGDGTPGSGVRVMSAQVFSGGSGGFAESYAYAADMGAVISQNSWGYTVPGVYEQAVLDAIDYYIATAGSEPGSALQGGLVVFAAGNDNQNAEWYPGYYEPTVAVASTDASDLKSGFSNFGAWVDISAPGGFGNPYDDDDVLSTFAGNRYGYLAGTSMACPHASGVAALVASENLGATPGVVRSILESTTDDLDDINPDYEGLLGSGRINAETAVNTTLDAVDPSAITDLSAAAVLSDHAELAWTAPADDAGDLGSGPVSRYDVRYATSPIQDEADFAEASPITAALPTPSEPGVQETLTVTDLPFDTEVWVAIRSIDDSGNRSPVSNSPSMMTGPAPVLASAPDTLQTTLETNADTTLTLTLSNEGPSGSGLDFTFPAFAAMNVLEQAPGGASDDPAIMGAGGPDEFGYVWIDSDQEGGPDFDWFDIKEIGTELDFTMSRGETVPLPFPFVFYGEVQTSVNIYEDGILNFGEFVSLGGGTSPIPDARLPNGIVAPYWLHLDTETGGTAYYYHDVANDRFIVQWDSVASHNTGGSPGDFTFQVILDDNGSSILFQYLDMNEEFTRFLGTVGIENHDGSGGLQVDYNDDYVRDSLAVAISDPPEFIADINPISGFIPGGENEEVAVTFTSDDTDPGDYKDALALLTNDPAQPSSEIPGKLTVQGGPPDIAVAPANLDYGEVIAGAQKSLTFTIYNEGAGPLQVDSIATNNPAFQLNAPGDVVIQPYNDSLVVPVVFAPTEVGSQEAAITIESNDPDTPLATVSLDGEGIPAPVIAVSPDSLRQTLEVGEEATRTVTLTNAGGSPLDVMLTFDYTGGNRPEAVNRENSDPLLMPGLGETSILAVPAERQQTPISYGTPLLDPTGVISHGAQPTGSVTSDFISFDVGVPGDVSTLGDGPDGGFDGAGAVGPDTTTAYHIVDTVLWEQDIVSGELTHLGDLSPSSGIPGELFTGMTYDLTTGDYYGTTSNGTVSYLYVIDVETASSTLIGRVTNTSTAIALGAAPNGKLYTYDISTDALLSVDKTTGAGTVIGSIGFNANYGQGMEYDVETGTMYMAAYRTGVNRPELRSVNLTTGATELIGVLDAVQVGWMSTPSVYAGYLQLAATDTTLAPGESVDIDVVFDAGELDPDVYEANIVATSNDPANPVVDTPILMDVVFGEPEVAVAPDTLDFGEVFVEDATEQVVTIHNDGNGPLEVLASTNNLAFAVDSSLVVALGDSASVPVTFAPTGIESYSGTLTLATNDPDEPTVTVALSGEGVPAPAIAVNPGSLSKTVAIGQTATDTLTITNDGEGALSFMASYRIGTAPEFTYEPVDPNYPRGDAALSTGATPNRIGGGRSSASALMLETTGSIGYGGKAALPEGSDFISFDFGTPGDATVIAPGPERGFPGAGAIGPNPDVAYHIVGTVLWRQNVETGELTELGYLMPASRQSFSGMTYDPTTESFYGITTDVQSSYLYKINVATVTADEIGQITDQPAAIALAATPGGQLYTYGIANDELAVVDKTTGAGTTVGSIGFDANFGQGMTFDAETGQMYMAAMNAGNGGQAELRVVNLETGNTALIGAFQQQMGWLGAPVASTGDFDYISIAPFEGTVQPGQSMDLTVTYDASELKLGAYAGDIVVNSNDPTAPSEEIATSLEVATAPYPFDLLPEEIAVTLDRAQGDTTMTQELTISNTTGEDQAFRIETRGAVGQGSLPTSVTGWSSDVRDREFVHFDLGAPGSKTPLADSPYTWIGEFVRGRDDQFYIIEHQNFGNTFYSVDAETGETASIGTTRPVQGESWGDLAGDPTDGTLYGIARSGSTSHLYTIDPETGETTLLVEITNGETDDPIGTMASIAVDGDGQMWGYELTYDYDEEVGDGSFLRINKETGEATVIAPIDFEIDDSFGIVQGLDYDLETGTMYTIVTVDADVGFQSQLRTVDLETGETTLVGPLGDSHLYGYLAIPSTGFVFVDTPLSSGTIGSDATTTIEAHINAGDLNAGTYEAEFVVISDEPGMPEEQIPVTLTVIDNPEVSFQPEMLAFSEEFVGSSATQAITVVNTGGDVLTVSDLQVSPAVFSIPDSVETSFTLMPGATRAVPVIFSPAETQSYKGTVTVVSNDPAGNVSATLTGEGIPVPALDPESFDLMAVVGQAYERTLAISNEGESPLSYAITSELVDVSAGPDASISMSTFEHVLLEEDFNDGIPDTWIVENEEPGGPGWTLNTLGSEPDGNYTGGTGTAAMADAIEYVPAGADTELITPLIMAEVTGDYTLSFMANYQDYCADCGGTLDVDITTDGGETWTNILRWNEIHGGFYSEPGEFVELNLAPYIEAGDSFQIRWRYHTPPNDVWEHWYAQIDDVKVARTFPEFLSVSPAADTLAAGETRELALAVDATGLDAGTYEVNLNLNTNDPAAERFTVPVTLEVIETLTVTPEPGPDTTRQVYPAEEFLVPLTVESAQDLGVRSFEFTLGFADSLFTALGVETEGTLSENAILSVNTDVPGEISVAAIDTTAQVAAATRAGALPADQAGKTVSTVQTAGKNASPAPLFTLAGEDTLLYVRLEAAETFGESELAFTDFLFNEGEPPVATDSTTYEVGALYGDVSLDGAVAAFDVALVMDAVVGAIELTPIQEIVADVSGNGETSAFDAALIMDFLLGRIECFPVEEGCEANVEGLVAKSETNGNEEEAPSVTGLLDWGTPERTQAPVTEGKGAAPEPEGYWLEVPIVVTPEEGKIKAVEVTAGIDTSAVRVEEVEASAPEGWHLAHHVSEGGHFTLALAGPEPLKGGPVASVTLRVADAPEGIPFTDARYVFNEEDAQAVGTRAGEAAKAESEEALNAALTTTLPETFAVLGSYPNPTSGETRIGLDLPAPAEITVSVYDALGRRVMERREELDAGAGRELRFDARSLPSGTYFYRLDAQLEGEQHVETGSFVLVR